MLTDDFLDSEKQSPSSVLKSALKTRLRKRLTGKPPTKDVEARDLIDRELGNVASKELVVISEDRLILPLVEVMPISATCGRIPLAGEHTLGLISVVKRYMEAPNARKQVNESIFILRRLSGHRLCKITKVFYGPSKSK